MIHIWLPNPQSSLRVWQPTTQSWQTAENWQEVATLASLQQGSKFTKAPSVCLYFSSIYLLTVQPNLPANQIKALGEAGRRYLFEDISIGSVEDLHVKIPPATTPNLYAIHGSDREQWENAVALAGLILTALLPDFLLLPTDVLKNAVPADGILSPQSTTPSDDAMTDFTPFAAIYYQDEATQLMAYSSPVPPYILGTAVSHLPLFLSKMPNLRTLWVANSLPEISAIADVEMQPLEVSPRPVSDATRQFFNFAIKKSENTVPSYVKTIAVVLLAAGIIGIIADGVRLYYYQKAIAQTKTAISQQYSQWFPNEKLNPQLNLQRQLQNKLLNNQAADDKLLPALSRIQPVLQQYQITANQLTYQGQMLQLTVNAKDNDTLSKAVNQLVGKGVNIKVDAKNGGTLNGGTLPATTTPTTPVANTAMNNKPITNTPVINSAINTTTAILQIAL